MRGPLLQCTNVYKIYHFWICLSVLCTLYLVWYIATHSSCTWLCSNIALSNAAQFVLQSSVSLPSPWSCVPALYQVSWFPSLLRYKLKDVISKLVYCIIILSNTDYRAVNRTSQNFNSAYPCRVWFMFMIYLDKYPFSGTVKTLVLTVQHILLHLPTSCNLELFAAQSYNLNRQPSHNTTLSIYCRFSNWNHSNGFFIWNHALGLLKIYPQYHAAAPPCLPQTIVTQNDIFRSKHF